ncbi:MAG: tRNA (guanosine(18)-2'-O)-methyltransferase [bacterium ADurb.Bin478]|nr:MAG: tRNA (guanosine(18)-2'-O)-methyltransferase [bacterium ADurb.Bin478]
MGAVFALPMAQSLDLAKDLQRLRTDHGVSLVATVLHDATASLPAYTPPHRCGLLFGTESQGLGSEWLSLCDERITLPMAQRTDSLNVAVAAGIFLYHCSRF